MNEVLRRAIFDAQFDEVDLSAKLAVDPKTVRNWLRGQLPHPRSRAALSRLLSVDEAVLWPTLRALDSASDQPAELAAVYPRRLGINQKAWLSFFASAQSEIGVLAYSALFLAEDAGLVRLLVEKATLGVRVHLALGDPDGRNVHRPGVEEEIGEAMGTNVRKAIALFEPLLKVAGVEVRLHDTVLYSSMYRSDEQLLVNQHTFGIPAARSPVYHFRGGDDQSEMFSSYLDSFERIWSVSRSPAAGTDCL